VTRPCLAAITLAPMGGGVAAVSRLLWRVFQDRWPEDTRLVTLLNDEAARRSLESSTATRMRFGAQMAAAQLGQQADWIMYSHLSIARVQAFVPPPMRRPYAVFIHGIEAWRELSPAQKSVLRGASLRVANSYFTAGRVNAMHPEIGDVVPCHLALAPDRESSTLADAAPAADIGPKAVIVVARMSASERYKGHDELLEAWPQVAARVSAARLVFVGDGDDLERLKSKAGALGIAESVVFPGFVTDRELTAFYRDAVAFAMPSRGEGFGLVYLEAMSHGLPCIAAADDAAGEIIEDGQTGFLIRQADRAALVDRLVRLLEDGELRARMGAAGRRRLHDRFSYARFSENMLSLINGAADGVAAPVWRRGAAL